MGCIKRKKIMDKGQGKTHHLLLNIVSVREGTGDWGPEKRGDRIDGAQHANLMLCSAVTVTTSYVGNPRGCFNLKEYKVRLST